jgi:hypothetical protein
MHAETSLCHFACNLFISKYIASTIVDLSLGYRVLDQIEEHLRNSGLRNAVNELAEISENPKGSRCIKFFFCALGSFSRLLIGLS